MEHDLMPAGPLGSGWPDVTGVSLHELDDMNASEEYSALRLVTKGDDHIPVAGFSAKI
jgi:hypothetical protein